MYANKFDNLNDMDKFLGNYNLPKVTQKEHKKFLYRNIFNYIFNLFKIEEDYLSDFFSSFIGICAFKKLVYYLSCQIYEHKVTCDILVIILLKSEELVVIFHT